jgi:hypothetical protein
MLKLVQLQSFDRYFTSCLDQNLVYSWNHHLQEKFETIKWKHLISLFDSLEHVLQL